MRALSHESVLLASLLLVACASSPKMKTVERVDIPRFMGDWYLLGHIPAAAEEKAWNGVESYRLEPGTTDAVETTFSFREGSFDGPLTTLRPKGWVESANGAEWGMKFYWWQGPFRFEYLVVYLDPDYTRTIIGRSARDYLWIMARTPEVPAPQWDEMVAKAKELGYDVSKLRRVPQRWGTPPDVSPADRHAGG